MSATNRGVVRNEHDFYPTPSNAVYSLLDARPDLVQLAMPDALNQCGLWLEPAVGDGAIIRAVETYMEHKHGSLGPLFDTVDIRPDCGYLPTCNRVHISGDFVDRQLEELVIGELFDTAYSAIITNPPFKFAREFVDQALRHWVCPVVMLQKLTWLGAMERCKWWQSLMPSWIGVLSERPFPDATEYAWFLWRAPGERYAKSTSRLEVLPPFSWTPTEQLRLELK